MDNIQKKVFVEYNFMHPYGARIFGKLDFTKSGEKIAKEVVEEMNSRHGEHTHWVTIEEETYANIIVTPMANANLPLSHLKAERKISTDLPSDAIGEVVTEAINNIWKDGKDPKGMFLWVELN